MTNVPFKLVSSGVRFDLIMVDEAHKLRNPGTPDTRTGSGPCRCR